ncbi:MAG TPA: hypothetical protein VFX89_20870 [Gammaproteobacteria bacterium]|nr:hypothetical protein [Gammaproteobacteria bacterium]
MNNEAQPTQRMLEHAFGVERCSSDPKPEGTPVTQSGAVFTVALRKTATGWRIAAWAWAKGKRQ